MHVNSPVNIYHSKIEDEKRVHPRTAGHDAFRHPDELFPRLLRPVVPLHLAVPQIGKNLSFQRVPSVPIWSGSIQSGEWRGENATGPECRLRPDEDRIGRHLESGRNEERR